MKWLILFLIVCIATLTVALFFRQGPAVSAVHEASPVIVSSSTAAEDTAVYSVHADYPVFGIPVLDSKIKGIIDAGIADIKSADANPSENAIKNEFVSIFEKPYVGPDVISVELILSQYTGGAHNNSVAVGINYDVKNQKFLSLDDVLNMTGKSLQDISNFAKEQLTLKYQAIQFPEGAAPSKENYATFVIEKDAIRFIFQEYQVESFAFGMPEISIPLSR